ncbi:MAG: hypothetical protein C5B50_15115 [Verrucomicrobia bacterium]|nr:MAG: hypothetical protein C5B50_15115 [Verrucomicrobiota bacterium]
MEWYYATDNQQRGPVAESQLDDLLRSGAVDRNTLVWRAGMDEWKPMHSARSLPPVSLQNAPPIASPPLAGTATCVECQRVFPQTDLVFLNQSWVCGQCKPLFLQRLMEGAPPPTLAGPAWRSGKQMVLRSEAALPDRCVRCNAPANGFRLRRKLYWHHPAWYLLIIISLLVYAIVAICIRKKAVVNIGLCEQHRAQRKWFIIGSWLAVLGGLGLLIGGISASSGKTALGGIVLLLGGAIFAAIKVPVVSATKMDDAYVWAKGAGEQFLGQLPLWSGKP